MKVAENCDIYSYGVMLLEPTGRAPVQPLEQGDDSSKKDITHDQGWK